MNPMRMTMQIVNAVGVTKGSVVAGLLLTALGCAPRVELEAPEKPITINLNVKIDHEIRVKVDKELDQVLSSNSGLF
jgi:acyl-coenzyme A thioesterase PaaI-like protein